MFALARRVICFLLTSLQEPNSSRFDTRECKTRISLIDLLRALREVRCTPTKIEHGFDRLTFDICSNVPRPRFSCPFRQDRHVENLIDLLAPLVRNFTSRVDSLKAFLSHVLDRLADPVDGIIDDDGKVSEGSLRTGDHEQVREAWYCDTVARGHLLAELLIQDLVFTVANVDAGECASDGVKADLQCYKHRCITEEMKYRSMLDAVATTANSNAREMVELTAKMIMSQS